MSVFSSEPTRRDGDRSVKLSWVLGEIVDDDCPMTATAQLFVSHDKHRKEFMAVVSRINTTRESGFRVERFTIGMGTRMRLGSVPCVRYSAAALENAVTTAVTELRERADEKIALELADPNSPA